MTKTFSAGIRDWGDLTMKQIRKVAVDSIQDVLEGAQTSAAGITAGGTLIEGRIPVVSGDLINSLNSSIASGFTAQGPASYAVTLADFGIGDFAEFTWTMEYARRIEYGFTGSDKLGRTFQQEGWHFVGANAAKFPAIVRANKKKVMG